MVAFPVHAHEPDYYRDILEELHTLLADRIAAPFEFADGFQDKENGVTKSILLLKQENTHYICIFRQSDSGWQCEAVSSPSAQSKAIKEDAR